MASAAEQLASSINFGALSKATELKQRIWYTLGSHHPPRPEDWPVMPVAYAGFLLQPVGFFPANPALDVPPPQPHANGHCHMPD